MEKTVFNNQAFHTLLLVGLGVLLCWNLYTFSISQNLIALIPAIVQVVVLVLVLMKHKHAKLGIKIWAIILMVGPGLSILGKTIKLLIGDDMTSQIGALGIQVVILLVGLSIFHFNNTTVAVKRIDEDATE